MCALIYQKTSEKVLILSPREGFQRAFDFSTWSEIRLGMYLSVVSAADDNAAGPNETMAINNATDFLCLGLKNSDNTTTPGVAGARFIGVGRKATSVVKDTSFIARNGSGGLDVFGYEGATLVDGSGIADNHLVFPVDPSPATAYAGFWGLRLILTNRGLATQSVAVTTSKLQPISGGTYTSAALLADLNAFLSEGTSRTIAWNDGAVAYDIPDAFYFRSPLYNNRVRLSAIYMKRYA